MTLPPTHLAGVVVVGEPVDDGRVGEVGQLQDVFVGKEYLFTATVNDSGEINLAKNSSIAQEMLRRYQNNEIIKLRPV